MTSNDNKKIDHHGNRNDLTPEVIINAINYPPGYPDNKQQEKCNKNEEKHKNSHRMQPMQSFIDTNPDQIQQNSKK
jgi:hypothetical protein